MRAFLGMLLWCAVDLAFVLAGKLFVRMISLGRWRGESLSSSEGRMYGPAGALSFKRDGQRVFTWSGMQLAGVVFCFEIFAAQVRSEGRGSTRLTITRVSRQGDNNGICRNRHGCR